MGEYILSTGKDFGAYRACVGERGLDREKLAELSTCSLADTAINLVVQGLAGFGKS